MVKIVCKEDCGNAPKKLLLKELTSAFAKGTAQRVLLPHLADDVVWEIVGTEGIEGKDAVAKMLAETAESGNKASKLEIENIITRQCRFRERTYFNDRWNTVCFLRCLYMERHIGQVSNKENYFL